MNKVKTALFIADTHYPLHEPVVLDIAKQIAKDLKPDYLGLLGDMFNADDISKFTYRNWEYGGFSTLKEILQFKEKIYEPLVKASGSSEVLYCLGNHEDRIKDFLKKIEAKHECYLEEWTERLNLKKHFPEAKIKQYNDYHKIGRLHLTHGEVCTGNHTEEHARRYGGSVLYGHLHTMAVGTIITKDKKIHSGWSMPCSMQYHPDYMKRKACRWVQGLMVGEFYSNRNFNLTPIIIINKKTRFWGKEYKCKI